MIHFSILQCVGTMLLSAHFLVYGVDGVGLKSTHLLGRILEAAAELMFILLLILIAKGYTVTRARLPQASSMKLAVFVCSYCVIYCTLFIYERISFDTGQVSYLFINISSVVEFQRWWVLKSKFFRPRIKTLWVSGARQCTKNSYRDLTPDLRQK